MKIGILTFHRAINYGAVLQCYALQETLKSMGHEVWIIDYRQPRVERTDRSDFLFREKYKFLLTGHLRTWWNYDEIKKKRESLYTRFDRYLNKYFLLTDACSKESIPQNFDIYIIGSDQVWNTNICEGIDPVYWGDFSKNEGSKLVTYAASTSLANIKEVKREVLESCLLRFDNIAVREKDIEEFLNQQRFLSFKVNTVLDPSLLANQNIWETMINNKVNNEPYVLYFGARVCSKRLDVLEVKAQKLANKMGIKVKSINFYKDSPEDFISKFKYAEAVITSSFHGVAFSLIFNRNLFAIRYDDEQDARYCNLLRSLHADHLLYDFNTDNEDICHIDYQIINKYLTELRQTSLDYLRRL